MTTGYSPSTGQDQHWACARKKAFPTEKMARGYAHRLRQIKGDNVVAYGCTFCGYWHAGKGPDRRR